MFKPPTDHYSTEVVTRRAPRWAWELIDVILGGTPRPNAEVSEAFQAMIDASEEGDIEP